MTRCVRAVPPPPAPSWYSITVGRRARWVSVDALGGARTEVDRNRPGPAPDGDVDFFAEPYGGVGGSSELKDRHLNTVLSSSVRGVDASGVKADGL